MELRTRQAARGQEPARNLGISPRLALQVVQPLSVVVKNSTTTIVNNTNVTNNQLPGRAAAANPVPVRSATPVKFEKVTPAVQTKIAAQATEVKKFGNDRKGWEAAAANPKVTFVGVAARSDVAAMQSFVAKYNLNFTNLNDADGSIWAKFNVPPVLTVML